MEGHGKKVWPDESEYEGEWRDNKMEGKGVYTKDDGTKYEGEWQ